MVGSRSCWLYPGKVSLPQSLVRLLGFGANHSLLFIVQYWRHHIETRQIQYNDNIAGNARE